MYSIVIQYLFIDHTPYRVVVNYEMPTVFLALHITSLSSICFVTGGLYLLILFIYFAPLPDPSPIW